MGVDGVGTAGEVAQTGLDGGEVVATAQDAAVLAGEGGGPGAGIFGRVEDVVDTVDGRRGFEGRGGVGVVIRRSGAGSRLATEDLVELVPELRIDPPQLSLVFRTGR